MTEAEWQKCRDPQKVLAWLRHTGVPSERKLTLFAAALCRRLHHLLTDDYVRHCRAAIAVWEKHADGLATNEEVQTAVGGAFADALDAAHAVAHPGETDFYAISFAAEAVKHAGDAAATARAAARAVAYDAVARAGDETVTAIAASWNVQRWQGRPQWDADEARVANIPAFLVTHEAECAAQCHILRDIFAFRELHIDSSVLMWNDGIVVRLAKTIYEERSLPDGMFDNASLAVLADALEEGGINDAGLLEHLRGPGPHVRGCHVLDAILGRM